MPATASRLAVFQESVIREMTRLAHQHEAINLAQGFPDFEPPEPLIAALEKSARGAVSPILDHLGLGAVSPGAGGEDRPASPGWRSIPTGISSSPAAAPRR